MDYKFNIGVINADGTKRPADINRPETLSAALHEMMDEKLSSDFTRLLTVNEFGSITSSKKLKKKLPESFDYFDGKFASHDVTAAYWDESNNWKAEYQNRVLNINWSDTGKYAAIVLENENINKRLLYVSTHQPSKDSKSVKKLQSRKDLKKLIEDSPDKYNTDGVVIAGDFNMKPSEMADFFGRSSIKLGITDDTVATTKAKNSIDNIVTTDAIDSVVEIYTEYDKFTHYPLIGQITLID